MNAKWKKFAAGAALALSLAIASPMQAAPSVYPTGTTIYDPERAENGYTVLSLLGTRAVIVIDMNGRVVKRWDNFNVAPGGPARILPGGIVIASNGTFPGHLETTELVARDFDGNELWRFDRAEEITIRRPPAEEGSEATEEKRWSSRQHHDWQLESFPAGYYSPKFTPSLSSGRKLLLAHSNRSDEAIADVVLEDDRIYELDADNNIVWDWRASDHIDELGFNVAERRAIRAGGVRDNFDWFHINSATYLGPNRWYDAGDTRFHPDNVVISSRQTSIIAIIDRSGAIVWQLGPDYADSLAEMAIGQIVGQHHAHLIPPGLPGAGNMLIFDNGGSGGYGNPTALSPTGQTNYRRHDSRVIEIDPVTLEVVWAYRAANFFAFNISGAQRLENGNTLITEGPSGRVFEVTGEGEIVWEYMQAPSTGGPLASPAVYRAYRLPYS
ncbi:MAG TPA: aryl-sulfate sulfotransferase, partial [Sphingomonadaceae bacterium]|nr:aryl-sulfate sulfotransferase [Sphingomonadaceae bacterium]